MTSTNTTFRASTTDLTVYAIDSHGEVSDLNVDGEPCATVADLAAFVAELSEQGYYDAETRDSLLASIAA